MPSAAAQRLHDNELVLRPDRVVEREGLLLVDEEAHVRAQRVLLVNGDDIFVDVVELRLFGTMSRASESIGVAVYQFESWEDEAQ